VSIRRACQVLEFDTSTYHYRSRRPDQAGFAARIKDICMTRVRYGYRRVHVLLQREGWSVKSLRTVPPISLGMLTPLATLAPTCKGARSGPFACR